MKMVMISADDYEKLSNAKKEAEAKMESYKQCIAGYESRIKELTEDNEKRAVENCELKIKVSSLETELKDCKYMYENKLKNTEASLSAARIDNKVNNSFIKTLRSQSEEDTNKMKELRQKYEAVLKANEKLASENNRLANDPEAIDLKTELRLLKKQYTDINNAYKSQKNTLYKLTTSSGDTIDVLRSQYICLFKDYERVILAREEAIKEIKSLKALLSQVATKIAKIYNDTEEDSHILDTLVENLKNYI